MCNVQFALSKIGFADFCDYYHYPAAIAFVATRQTPRHPFAKAKGNLVHVESRVTKWAFTFQIFFCIIAAGGQA
jgi:hypothetical protein